MNEKDLEEQENSEEREIDPDEGSETSGSNTTRNAIIAIVMLVLIAIAVFYFVRSRSAANTAAADKEEVIVSVKVAKAEKDSISTENTAIGTVAPAEQTTLSASISAQIKQMRLLKNIFVQKGEILAVLATQDFTAQRAEAAAALDEARLNLETLQKVTIPQTSAQTEKDLSDAKATADNARSVAERRKVLYAKGGISLKELESSQLVLKNAENNLRLVQKNVKLNAGAVNPNARAIAENKIKQAENKIRTIDTQAGLAQVRAPITGVVTDQFQFEGDFASQGAKLLTISDIGEVIVKANFADTVVANLRTGDLVTVSPPSTPDEKMSGQITLISRSTDPQNRTVEIWAKFANGRGVLRAGDAVQFIASSKPATEAVVIPISALQLGASNADGGTVMVVGEDSIAHEKKVKVGIRSSDKYQIISGLNGGETVVIEGNYALPDGTKVEIAKDEETDK